MFASPVFVCESWSFAFSNIERIPSAKSEAIELSSVLISFALIAYASSTRYAKRTEVSFSIVDLLRSNFIGAKVTVGLAVATVGKIEVPEKGDGKEDDVTVLFPRVLEDPLTVDVVFLSSLVVDVSIDCHAVELAELWFSFLKDGAEVLLLVGAWTWEFVGFGISVDVLVVEFEFVGDGAGYLVGEAGGVLDEKGERLDSGGGLGLEVGARRNSRF